MKSLTNSVALARLTRGNVDEVVISGAVAVASDQLEVKNHISSKISVPMRSLFKPWQYIATGRQAEEVPDLMCVASHSGHPKALETLQQLFINKNISVETLTCPPSLPLEPEEARRLKQLGTEPNCVYHPCSGKHAWILSSYGEPGSRPEDILDKHHMFQKNCQNVVQKRLGYLPEFVKDSCGLWCPVLPLSEMAQLWQHLPHDVAAKTLVTLWQANPDLVGGPGRLDSEITENTSGQVLAKEGAGGLIALTSLRGAWSIVVKLASGYHQGHLALGLLSAMKCFVTRDADLESIQALLEKRVSSLIEVGHILNVLDPSDALL
jgi:L-asparaginase II